jgi:aminomethyltransferase
MPSETPPTENLSTLRTTALHGLHIELGARLVPFAGWSMPVQYPSGVTVEHRQCREAAALFDVSHMGQVVLRSADRAASGVGDVLAALECLIPADLVGLAPFQQRYGMFTASDGGILDDLMVTRRDEDVFIVVNASNASTDIAHLRACLPGTVDIEMVDDRSLLALQGPRAIDVLRQLDTRADDLVFMTGAFLELEGASCFVTRSGYTGEDGFEISVPSSDAGRLARRFLAFDEVAPAGLGARDTLRLEAGLCLHGHDISPAITPVQAGLTWAIQKVRRAGGARAGGYPGAQVIDRELADGPTKRRVGLSSAERVPVREGSILLAGDGSGRRVGDVTSGTTTPTVGHPIAMAYVEVADATADSRVFAQVRDKQVEMTICALPFVPHRYVRRSSLLTNADLSTAATLATAGNHRTEKP